MLPCVKAYAYMSVFINCVSRLTWHWLWTYAHRIQRGIQFTNAHDVLTTEVMYDPLSNSNWTSAIVSLTLSKHLHLTQRESGLARRLQSHVSTSDRRLVASHPTHCYRQRGSGIPRTVSLVTIREGSGCQPDSEFAQPSCSNKDMMKRLAFPW